MLEPDALTVPVRLDGYLDAGVWTDPDDPNNSYDGWVHITLNSEYYTGRSGSGIFGDTGWRLSPGRSYSVTIEPTAVNMLQLQFSAPPGFKCYIDDVLTTRWSGNPSDEPYQINVRFESDRPMSFGDPSALRPGRIFWAIGLGQLTSGHSAGALTLKNYNFDSSVYTPAALDYGNASTEVKCFYQDGTGYLEQVVVPAGVVAIIPISASQYYVRFYDINSTCLDGSGLPNSKYVINDPTGTLFLYQYLVGNANPSANPLGHLEILLTIQDGSISRTRSTSMTRTSVNAYSVNDWNDTTQPVNGVLRPTVAKTLYVAPNGAETTSIGAYWQETRTYFGSDYGRDLAGVTLGGVTTSFGYTDDRLTSAATPGGQWIDYVYYTDWDRLGQVCNVYKPFGDQPTKTTTGEVTTYTYLPDWTGRKTLPSTIETRIGGLLSNKVVHKTVFTHDFTSPTKRWQDRWSNTYNGQGFPEYQLMETVRKDYFGSGANDYLVTTILSFHNQLLPVGELLPQHRFFEGLPYAEIRPDGKMTVVVYIRGSYSDSTNIFTPNLTGKAMLKVVLEGTNAIPSSGVDNTVAYPMFSYNGYQQNTHSGFRLISGKSIAKASIIGHDGYVRERLQYACAGDSLTLVTRDVVYYKTGGLVEKITRHSPLSGSWDVESNIWETGRLKSTKDEHGQTTEFAYISDGKVFRKTQSGTSLVIEGALRSVPEIVRYFGYDDAGRLTHDYVSGSGDSLTNFSSYDNAGRLSSRYTPDSGVVSYSYPSPLKVTASAPDGGAKTTDYYPDGRVKSITGSAVVSETYSYTFDDTGKLCIRRSVGPSNASSPRYTEETYDWLRRSLGKRRPGFTGQADNIEAITYYPSDSNQTLNRGRLQKIERTGLSPIVYEYHAQLVTDATYCVARSGLDIDGGGLTAAGVDRITDDMERFELDQEGALWQVKRTWDYIADNNGSPTLMAVSRARLTYFGQSSDPFLRAETRTYDVFGNEKVVRRYVYPTENRILIETKLPGKSSAAPPTTLEHQLCGFRVLLKDENGLVFATTYDSLGRKATESDPRTGIHHYSYQPGTTHIMTASDGAGKVLFTRNYDVMGRLGYESDALGYTKRLKYTYRGEIAYVWGSGTYPVSYEYNAYGERTIMRTYSDPNNYFLRDSALWPTQGSGVRETVWEFDEPSGFLWRKYDAEEMRKPQDQRRFVEYAYNARGQLIQRKWARDVVVQGSAERLTTTYDYYGDNTSGLPADVQAKQTGELYRISYNDNNITPWVINTYDRRGMVSSTTDGAGTHQYGRCICGKLESETLGSILFPGLCMQHKLETIAANGPKGRSVGYRFGIGGSLGLFQDIDWEYTTTGRISSIRQVGVGDRFQYAYLGNSRLIDTMSHVKENSAVDWQMDYDYEPNRDLVTSVTGKWNGIQHTRFEYAYDDRRQRTIAIQRQGLAYQDMNDDTFRSFAYNGRGELLQAYDYQGADPSVRNAPMSGRLFDYNYDAVGNRRSSNSSSVPDLRDEYQVNFNNQYTSRENNTIALGGVADPDARIAVGSDAQVPAGRTAGRRHWGDNILVNNANGNYFYGDIDIYAVKPTTGLQDLLRKITTKVALPPDYQAHGYDLDGNMLHDTVWNFQWDAENRLRAMWTNKAGTTQGVPMQLEFTYDARHRRVQKKVFLKNGAQWEVVPARLRRYVYHDWNLVGEFSGTGDNLTLQRSYLWGLDLVQSLDATGGVNALLQITDYEAAPDAVYFPSFDGNGNVTSLVNAGSGAVAAAYEYSPYGELLRCEGEYAYKNPFRFSTKYMDDETGLIYYGRRYYDPRMGRFISRDPKEELAGLNLYAFVHNNPINKWDYLGMEECGQQDDDGYGSENSWESDLEADIGDLNDAAAEGRRELDALWDRVEEEEKAAQQSASSLPDPNSIAGFNATITSTSVYINQTPSDYDLASPSVVEAIIELSSDGRLASSGSARGMNVPRPTLLEIENRLMENLAKERDPLMRWQRWRDIIQFRENNGLRTPTSPRDAEFRPDLPRVWTNPKHNQFSPSPQPRNALDLYKLSIPDGAGNRWAIDNNGVIHRFASDCNNIFHWNGSTGGSRPIQERTIPNEILLQLRPR